MLKLTGTEKQIAYGEKCRKDFIKRTNEEIQMNKRRAENSSDNIKLSRLEKASRLENGLEYMLNKYEKASDWIHFNSFGIEVMIEKFDK